MVMPSLRPELVQQRIRDYAAASEGFSYELVVVSPFVVEGPNVKHVPEGDPKGTIYATNLGYEHSKGNFIAYTSDDVRPMPGALANMVRFLKRHPAPFIGSFRMVLAESGREREQSSAYDLLYACWGCLSRESIKKLGGLFDPVYHSYWADPDLSMRAWTRGGMVRVCPDAWFVFEGVDDQVKSGNVSKFHDDDQRAFFDRWHEPFGNNVPVGRPLINRTVPLDAMWYTVEGLLSTARDYIAIGALKGAEACLKFSLHQFPHLRSHDETYLLLGSVLQSQNLLEEATWAYEKALEYAPNDARAWKGLGINRLHRKDYQGAASALRTANQKNSHDPETMISLGWVLLETGQAREALTMLRQGAERMPDYVEGWVGLALCARQLGEQTLFEQAYQKARAVNPHHPALAPFLEEKTAH